MCLYNARKYIIVLSVGRCFFRHTLSQDAFVLFKLTKQHLSKMDGVLNYFQSWCKYLLVFHDVKSPRNGYSSLMWPHQVVGRTLRDSMSGGGSVWVVARALDTLYDVFGSDECPPHLFSHLQIMPVLQSIAAQLPKQVILCVELMVNGKNGCFWM